jgi:hypothetical protein
MIFEAISTVLLTTVTVLSFLILRIPKHKMDKLELSLKAVESIRGRDTSSTSLEKIVEYDALLHTKLLSKEAEFIDEKDLNRDEANALTKLRPYVTIWKSDQLHYLNINTINIFQWKPCRNLFIFLSSFGLSAIYCLFFLNHILTTASHPNNENAIVLAIAFIAFLAIATWLLIYSILEFSSFKSHLKILSRYLKASQKKQSWINSLKLHLMSIKR